MWFLMHRVELKAHTLKIKHRNLSLFLMHRVELKVENKPYRPAYRQVVPNAPCGVESSVKHRTSFHSWCLFLMHRVELKAEPNPTEAGTEGNRS